MVDTAPGPGWWVASDGRWYPPELHPDIVAFSRRATRLVAPGHAPLRPRVPASSIRHLGDERRIEGAPVAHMIMLERALRALDPATDPSFDPARAQFVEPVVPPLSTAPPAVGSALATELDALLAVPTEFPSFGPGTTLDLDDLDLRDLDLHGLGLDDLDLRPIATPIEPPVARASAPWPDLELPPVAAPVVVAPVALVTPVDLAPPRPEVLPTVTRTLPPVEPAEGPSTLRKVGVLVAGVGILALGVAGVGWLTGRDDSSPSKAPTTSLDSTSGTTTPGVVSSPGSTASSSTATTAGNATTVGTAPSISAPLAPVSVFSLTVGTCVNNPDLGKGLVSTLTSVPCDQPHTHEVFHRAAYVATPTYDADALANFATQQCREAFVAYVGTPYDQSSIYFLHLAPSADSWNQNHDREIACLLYKPGGLTASAKDSKA
jgi:hypothetical protein